MSAEYEGQDLLDIAKQAEADLNSHRAKHGSAGSTSVDDTGVDETVTSKFPGSTVTTGSAASGAGDNREIPVEEGGDIDVKGRPTKAGDFEGDGGPETKANNYARDNEGSDDAATSYGGNPQGNRDVDDV